MGKIFILLFIICLIILKSRCSNFGFVDLFPSSFDCQTFQKYGEYVGCSGNQNLLKIRNDGIESPNDQCNYSSDFVKINNEGEIQLFVEKEINQNHTNCGEVQSDFFINYGTITMTISIKSVQDVSNQFSYSGYYTTSSGEILYHCNYFFDSDQVSGIDCIQPIGQNFGWNYEYNYSSTTSPIYWTFQWQIEPTTFKVFRWIHGEKSTTITQLANYKWYDQPPRKIDAGHKNWFFYQDLWEPKKFDLSWTFSSFTKLTPQTTNLAIANDWYFSIKSFNYEEKNYYFEPFIRSASSIFVPIGLSIVFAIVGIGAIICIFLCVLIKSKRTTVDNDAAIKEIEEFDENLDIDEGVKEVVRKIKLEKSIFAIQFEDIKLIKQLGEGGSGCIIFKSEWKGQLCAIKMFRLKTFSTEMNFDDFKKELEMMFNLRHPNIIQFFGATLHSPRIGIVLEYCSNGELYHYILKNAGKIDFSTKLRFLNEIANGIEYLHDRNIIHRDLKTANILLNDSLSIKIIDFGTSRIKEEQQTKLTKLIGTSYYMAPEITEGFGNYCNKVDIFSFSIICFELFEETVTPYGDVKFNVELKVAKDPLFRPLPKKDDYPNWIKEMMIKCWDSDPSVRLSIKEIKKTIQKNTSIK